MNFVILHIPNSGNNGSAMMAINTISFLIDKFGEKSTFYCDFSSNYSLTRIKAELPPETRVFPLREPMFKRGPNLITSFVRRIFWLQRYISKIKQFSPSALVILGGDDFSEYYSGYKIVVTLYSVYRLSSFFNVLLLGHTLGPFFSWRKKLASFFLRKARIVTREKRSLQLAQDELNLKEVIRGHDLAWLDLPNQKVQTQRIELSFLKNLVSPKIIILVISSLVKQYNACEEDYFDSWVEAIRMLREIEELKDCTIVLMPHVFHRKRNDDVWAINEVEKKLGNLVNVVYLKKDLLPSTCRQLLSMSFFSISCRMHASVSTFQTGKPSIPISYSVKYNSVLGEDLGMKDLIIEATSSEIWKNGQFAKKLKEKVLHLLARYDSYCNHVDSNVKKIKEDQVKVLEKIFNFENS